MLEDLRSHLLSKRHKMEAEMNAQKHQGESYDRRPSKYQHLEKKASSHDRRRDYREHKRNVEDIDSPENYGDHPSGSGRAREGRYEDPEQAARRAKLLEIDRETSRRKEQAREELKARREMRREERRDGQEPVKRHRHDDSGATSHKKRKHASAEEQVITVSDKSDDTASDSESSESYEEDSQNSEEEEEDEDIPNSPLSVGDLSKSEHRHRNSSRNSSKSKTHSPPSGSGSPSNSGSGSGSSDSKSPGSRDSSKSPTKRNKEDSDAVQRSNIFEEDDEKAEKATEEAAEAKASESGDEKEKVPLADDLPSYYPALQGCRSVEEFQCLNRIEEGTYGVVYRAKDKRTEEIVALKRLKMEKEKEGFPITSLREINTLLKGQHPNIVTVREIVVGSNMDKIFIVMDYVEHDLKSLMETMKHKKQAFLPGEVKCLTQQLLRAVAHLHDIWILHRDLKTSNLLLSHKGILKVSLFFLNTAIVFVTQFYVL